MKQVALPWQSPKALLHTIYTCLLQGVKAALLNTQKQTQGGCQIEETKKYGPNERGEQNPRERTMRNRDNQPIRCRVQNTGNQYAHRNGGVWLQNRGKVKAMKSEIKENAQETNSNGKETRTQISGLGQNEEINTQPELNEETRIQKKKKNEKRLRTLQDNFKCSNI